MVTYDLHIVSLSLSDNDKKLITQSISFCSTGRHLRVSSFSEHAVFPKTEKRYHAKLAIHHRNSRDTFASFNDCVATGVIYWGPSEWHNNNNNNNLDDIYSAVIYGASHTREFTAVHQGQSRSAPGGRQLAGQAANLTFESACRLP